MGSIAKNIRYSLFVFCIFISMPMLGKQLGDNLLDVLELRKFNIELQFPVDENK